MAPALNFTVFAKHRSKFLLLEKQSTRVDPLGILEGIRCRTMAFFLLDSAKRFPPRATWVGARERPEMAGQHNGANFHNNSTNCNFFLFVTPETKKNSSAQSGIDPWIIILSSLSFVLQAKKDGKYKCRFARSIFTQLALPRGDHFK